MRDREATRSMKNRFRLIRRGERGAKFYCVDSETGKRTALGTSDADAAKQIVLAKNQALRQPALNLQIAKAYLAGSDSGVATRTWQDALNVVVETKYGPTRERWSRAAKEKAFNNIRKRIIIETTAEQLLDVLRRGTVSTNVHLRKLHNFCVDMNWLPWPIVPKKQWPVVRYKEKRAVTLEEHERILDRKAISNVVPFTSCAGTWGVRNRTSQIFARKTSIGATGQLPIVGRKPAKWLSSILEMNSHSY
jgi:hypothetical protein